MSRFDSVVVGNDLVSEHWLAEQFPVTVKSLRATWKDREEHGKRTPRSGLITLSSTFGAELVRLREQHDADRLRALHDGVRDALQIPGEEAEWSSTRSGSELTVPAVASSTPGGTHLLVLQARDAETVEDVLDAGDDGEGAGHLLTSATVDGAEQTGTAKVISAVFLAEESPALVLVTAGAWVLLAERGRWPEGRWLAVDLATALERRDTKAAGELETIAALISGDSLLPADDGTTPLLTLLEDSVKHAVGVSKDLRNGIRESIELLATEMLHRRRTRDLPTDQPGLAADLTQESLRYLTASCSCSTPRRAPNSACCRSAFPSTPRATGWTGCANSSSSRSPAPPPRRASTSTSRWARCSGWSTRATRRRRWDPTASPGRLMTTTVGFGSRRCVPISSVAMPPR